MGFRDLFRPTPITAAAATIADPRDMDQMFNAGARTVGEAWKIWHLVGEIQYATNQQARLVSRVEWDVQINGEQQDREDSTELLDATFGNQLPDLAQAGALNMQVGGGYILARWPQKTDGQWDVVSLQQDHHMKELLTKADIRVKVTNPDPTNPQMTVSPVIAAIDVATDLLLARAQSRAHRRNRTAQQGILLYPNEGAGQDPESFKKRLLTTITAPLMDEKSAASVVPNLVGFQGDMIDKWKYLEIAPTFDTKLHEQIQALVRQLAMILDSPPEILLGMGDVNHWSSWAIQEDNWFGHSEPLARRVGEGFAEAIAAAADLDPSVVEVLPDPSPLLQRRPALSDVAAAHAARVVSDDYYRAQLGADEDDAPDALPEPEPVEEPEPEPVPEDPSSDAPVAPVIPMPVAAAVDPPFSTQRLLDIDRQAVDSTIDLADIAVARVLERVGAQLRARVQKTDAAETVKGVPNEELPVKLGVSDLPGLDQTITDTLNSVVPKRWATIVSRTYKQVRAAGVDITVDEDNLTDSTYTLVTALAAVARDALDGRPTDANVWTAAQRALTVAGGGGDPAPVLAAFGISQAIGIGIALGGKALLHIAREVGLLARQFRWVYGNDPRSKPHPVHEALDGQSFDGEALIEDGIRWYPGDHAGCLCSVEPIWEEAG